MTQTALTYGGALFDLAQEEGQLEKYMEELRLVRTVTEENPDFTVLLSSRSIPQKERQEILDKCFRGRVSPYLLNYMKLLCQNGAIRELPGCIRQFELCYNRFCGILEVSAVSAFPLSEIQREKLKKKLSRVTGKAVSLSCVTDPSLLGGIRLEMEGSELDGSVRRRLDEMEKMLSSLVL